MKFEKLNSLVRVDVKKVVGCMRLEFRRAVYFGNTHLRIISIKIVFRVVGLTRLAKEER